MKVKKLADSENESAKIYFYINDFLYFTPEITVPIMPTSIIGKDKNLRTYTDVVFFKCISDGEFSSI